MVVVIRVHRFASSALARFALDDLVDDAWKGFGGWKNWKGGGNNNRNSNWNDSKGW